jgi:DNA-binding Xre family transcriptional regulator
MGKYEAPTWSKQAQKKLIDKGISKKELAQVLKVNYQQMIGVLSGSVRNDTMQERICTYLNVKT